MAGLVCWHCGGSLKETPKPISRLSQCKACGADLHVCLLCKYYNPNVSDRCDHEMAEPAREIDLANFCHYFRPRPDAFQDDKKTKSDEALNKLKGLFAKDESEKDSAATDAQTAESAGEANEELSDYDAAKAKFDSLFK